MKLTALFTAVLGLFFLTTFAEGTTKCALELEAIVRDLGCNKFTFMKRMYLAMLSDGTAKKLITRFAYNHQIIIRISNAMGDVTSLIYPPSMQEYVTPAMSESVKDLNGMRAYAIGSAFDDDATALLMAYSGLVVKSNGSMTLLTAYAPKSRAHKCIDTIM